jgi:hypothetical protein
MRIRLLLCLLIFASLGIFLIGLPPVAKETNQKPPASEDVKKNVEEARPDRKPDCTGMKAQSRPASEHCLH